MRQQLIVGMPASGKSTFIAAIRHILLSGATVTELELTGLADQEEHLNSLEHDWLECREVQRTKPSSEGWVQFHVRERSTGNESTLSVPDLRGETFEQPACSGQCQYELYKAVADSDGILLFTNADREDDTLLISDLGDILNEEDSEAFETSFFDPQEMPEEIKIVEFLQMANRRPLEPKRRRIALLISAWDVVQEGTEPKAWLNEKRPMLAQYLEYNKNLWEARIYGVSAQGGQLPRDKGRLSRIRTPSKRVKLVGHGACEHDLTSPLCWLSGA